MTARRDALAGAAEWIGVVEHDARDGLNLVATVGRVDAVPGAGNVIAGEAVAALDVRHAEDGMRTACVERLLAAAKGIAVRRNIGVSARWRLEQNAVPMNDGLTALLARAVDRGGFPLHMMASGAGHDAMILAPHMPCAMLFLRTPGGVSHHPDENVLESDVAAALATGSQLIEDLAHDD
jgi:allantoate deiminase